MLPIRLVREIRQPGRSGPSNGQYALQRALRRRAVPWLRIGGPLREGEIPWFWCWADREAAAMCARTGHPFVAGPNMLFADSRQPCRTEAEREICRAASCRLLFTESAWYRDLIEEHRGPANRAPIVVWPYPIEPLPGGPLPARYDLAIYEKSGVDAQALAGLRAAWPRHVRVRYGRYRREEWFEVVRRSRCCVYFSDDDRGPLALAECLLAGCPAVGIPRGAPWIEPGRTGVLLERFEPRACVEAVAACHRLDRQSVAATAAEQFDTERIVETVIGSLYSSRGA
jgi:hypothetical protein